MADDGAAIDIAQIVAEHHQSVYRYAYWLTGSVPDAEDLTQQVFLVAQQKLAQLRKREAARGWLFAILRNGFLKIRQQHRALSAGSLQLDIESIPAKGPSREEIDRERLEQALAELPAKHRLVVTMFYYEGCSYRQIAERLKLPIGTVMSRLARAKGRLRQNLFQRQSHEDVCQQQSTAK